MAFTLRLVPAEGSALAVAARPSRKDIVLENAAANLEAYMPIYGGASRSSTQLPSSEPQVLKNFKFTKMKAKFYSFFLFPKKY